MFFQTTKKKYYKTHQWLSVHAILTAVNNDLMTWSYQLPNGIQFICQVWHRPYILTLKIGVPVIPLQYINPLQL